MDQHTRLRLQVTSHLISHAGDKRRSKCIKHKTKELSKTIATWRRDNNTKNVKGTGGVAHWTRCRKGTGGVAQMQCTKHKTQWTGGVVHWTRCRKGTGGVAQMQCTKHIRHDQSWWFTVGCKYKLGYHITAAIQVDGLPLAASTRSATMICWIQIQARYNNTSSVKRIV